MSYPNPPSAPDPWTDRFAALAAIRGFMGESTVRESSEIGITTRVTMPLLQAISIAVAFVVFCGGGWIMMDGVVTSFGIELEPGLYLLTLLVVGLVGGALWVGLGAFFNRWQKAARWSFVALGVLTVLVALMNAMLTFRQAFEWYLFLEVLGGAGAMVGSALLMYHQTLNIADPYWRTSPAERELLALWRQGPSLQAYPKTAQRVPYRHGNRKERILLAETTPDEELLPADIELEVLDFLELAQNIGIGRNAWIGGVTRRLPSTGAVMTRTKYDEILDRLEQDGYIIRGGSGKAARWAGEITPTQAYDRECSAFEEQWGYTLGLETDEEDQSGQ